MTHKDQFTFAVYTPVRVLIETQVDEVVLPGHDGEVGVLGGHADFIGKIGTGPLKMVIDGNDYWAVVSQGVFEVIDGKLTLLTELAETSDEIDSDAAQARLQELESVISNKSAYEPDFDSLTFERAVEQARLAVWNRANKLH